MKTLQLFARACALPFLVGLWIAVELVDAAREARLKNKLGAGYEGPAAD